VPDTKKKAVEFGKWWYFSLSDSYEAAPDTPSHAPALSIHCWKQVEDQRVFCFAEFPFQAEA
jgi:hypothetical protein